MFPIYIYTYTKICMYGKQYWEIFSKQLHCYWCSFCISLFPLWCGNSNISRQKKKVNVWKVVEPPWKICERQIGSFSQIGMNIKNIWNHHPVRFYHRKGDLGSTLGQYYATIAFLQQSGIRHHHHPNCWSRPVWLVEVSGATCFWLIVPVSAKKQIWF